jgi:transposase-like protein
MTQFVRAATTKLTADKRKAIAIQALARSASISALAADNGVSRPLIYREVDKARAALDDAFSPTQADDADKVIFMLPVTRRWLDQTMLGLTQIARASFRGVIEFMHDILGISASLGTVHNVHQSSFDVILSSRNHCAARKGPFRLTLLSTVGTT